MDFVIRSFDVTANGREIVRERAVSADRITIGRASENTIHLPDLAIEQHHIVIDEPSRGRLEASAAGTLGFTHDGVATDHAVIDPARGGEIGVGSFRLEFARDAAGGLIVSQRRVAEDPGAARERLAGFGLEGALPGKRIMAWAGLALILIAFLALPIITHLTRPATSFTAETGPEGRSAVMMDAAWSTGALSSAHHALEGSCEACHVTPFVAVRDETCRTCHERVGDHAMTDRLLAGMPEFSGGEALLWSVAQGFGKPGPGACTDCHTEHEGAGRMEPTAQRFCADCHNGLDTRLTDTALGNAADFGTLHPQFQALVRPTREAQEARLELTAATKDFNGLKFPHDMHLSTSNGVARMALRLDGEVLDCASCHTATADGVRFVPVDMEDSCEACHSLVYDRVGDTFRSLNHGNTDQVQADLIAADRAPRRPVVSGRRRPGQYAQGGLYYSNFSTVMLPTLGNALADGGLCGECHYRDITARGALAVHPVVQRSRYFQHGWFDHAAHEQEDCTSCHAADSSDSAFDLLLPDLASCRDCHMGEAAREADVPSSCAMCHSFHPRDGAAAAPPRIVARAGEGRRR